MSFQNDVKKLRKQLKMTQQQLGDLLGVGRVSVNRWEAGVGRPSRMSRNFVKHLSRKEAESNAKKKG